jgi:hypothetical protein
MAIRIMSGIWGHASLVAGRQSARQTRHGRWVAADFVQEPDRGNLAQAELAIVALPALSRSITPKSSSEQIKLDLVLVTSESERHAQT